MSSQYLSTCITDIHGKQFEHRQTALPPRSPISLVCQTRCNVFLPPKIIPSAYMESPRMGPNLPYKPATPNRKTSHTRTSQSRKTSTQSRKTSTQSRKTSTQSRKTSTQSRKTSHPRTTRSSLFPLIIIHVRRYGESSRGPYHPWGRAHEPARVCVPARPHAPARQRCVPARAHTLACLGRQEDREDSRHTEQDRRHAGSSSPALPHAACLKCLPRLPALPVCPDCLSPPARFPPCPYVSYCQ